jgi:hypothetical protein
VDNARSRAIPILAIAVLASCSAGTSSPGNSDAGSGGDAGAAASSEYLPYRPGSLFVFEAKHENGRTGTTTTGYLLWKVTSLGADGSITLLGSSAMPGEADSRTTFYLRKAGAAVEVSQYGTWERCFDPHAPGTGGVGFAIAGGITKPSNMFGTMKESGGFQDVTVPAGAFPGAVYVRREYMPDGTNDPYLYDVGAVENWDTATGLVRSENWYQDWQMGYPNNISLRTTHALVWAELHRADGTVQTLGTPGGYDQIPPAPTSLIAFREGSPKLTWKDMSVFEEAFAIQRREGDTGAFAEVGVSAADTDIWYDQGADPAKNYTYRVLARNRAGDSAPSGEASVSAEGSPSAAHYAGWWFKTADTEVALLCSVMASPVVTEFALTWWDGAAWREVAPRVPASEATPKFGGTILSLQKSLYWTGSAPSFSATGATSWPAGARLGVKTANTVGTSAVVEATYTP